MIVLTPFQAEALMKLPRDGRPAEISDDAAFVLRVIPTVVIVEEYRDDLMAQRFGGVAPSPRKWRAALTSLGLEALLS